MLSKKNIVIYIMIALIGLFVLSFSVACEEEQAEETTSTEVAKGPENVVNWQEFAQHKGVTDDKIKELNKRIVELEQESEFSFWIFFTWLLLAGGLVGVWYLTKKKE